MEGFTQVKMPPVAVDNESGFARFMEKFLVNPGPNIYVTILKHSPKTPIEENVTSLEEMENDENGCDECFEIRLDNGGQSVPIEIVVVAVADVEAVHQSFVRGKMDEYQ